MFPGLSRIVADRRYVRLGFPYTVDPAYATGTFAAGTNQARYVRVLEGGTISSVMLIVATASGNVCVAAYRNSGSGRSSVPGAQLASSGSVACPAAGDATISLGATITLYSGDWLAIAFDNSSAIVASSPNGSVVSTLGSGRHFQQLTAFPLPASPSSLTALKATVPLLIGA